MVHLALLLHAWGGKGRPLRQLEALGADHGFCFLTGLSKGVLGRCNMMARVLLAMSAMMVDG